jgi:hypothetical protein
VLVGVAVAVAVGAGVGVGATMGAQDARKRHRVMQNARFINLSMP